MKKTPDLTPLVKELAKEYAWHRESMTYKPVSAGDAINSGLCDIFAARAKAKHPRMKVIYDRSLDHCYLRMGDRYYDAENPKGVTKRSDMVYGGERLGGLRRKRMERMEA